jgi:hypothetical protein
MRGRSSANALNQNAAPTIANVFRMEKYAVVSANAKIATI